MTTSTLLACVLLAQLTNPPAPAPAQPGVGPRYGPAPAAGPRDSTDDDAADDAAPADAAEAVADEDDGAAEPLPGEGDAPPVSPTEPPGGLEIPDAAPKSEVEPKPLEFRAPAASPSAGPGVAPLSVPEQTVPPQSENPPATRPASPAQGRGEELVPVHPTGTEPSAEQLLRFAISRPIQPGEPPPEETPLLSVLAAKGFVQPYHLEGVQSYWQLFVRAAEARFADDEHQKLVDATAGGPQDNPLVQAALAASQARRVRANLELVEAQHDLAERLGWAPDRAALPWPSDRPLVGPYRTHYESLFANRPVASQRDHRQARRIHDTLPITLESIRAYAAAAAAAENLWSARLQAAPQQGIDLDPLLECHAQLRQQRRAFLEAVLDYNLAIAQYALLAAGDSSTPSDLLPMLIKVSRRPAAPNPLPEQPVGGIRPLSPTLAPTFAPPAGSAVVPATAEEPIEPQGQFVPQQSTGPLRSVVVPSPSRP